MLRCPRCGGEAQVTKKEWNYSIFHVKGFSCLKCGKKFNVYYRDNELSHTIPKAKQ